MERVSYYRLARRELNETAQFYNSESPGLGSAFLDEVERCTQAIVDYPEAGSLIIGSVRRRLVLRSLNTINQILDIYRIIYNKGMNTSQALNFIEEEITATDERDEIVTFIRESGRGIIKRFAKGSQDDE